MTKLTTVPLLLFAVGTVVPTLFAGRLIGRLGVGLLVFVCTAMQAVSVVKVTTAGLGLPVPRMYDSDFRRSYSSGCFRRIVSARAADEFAVRLKIGMQVLLPNARHEILQENDTVRQRFWAAFDAYMDVAAAA